MRLIGAPHWQAGTPGLQILSINPLNPRVFKMEDAVRSGDLKRGQELIWSGDNVNPRLSVGTGSLLMVSIRNSYKDIALALLEAGADVHAKDRWNWTALHFACD